MASFPVASTASVCHKRTVVRASLFALTILAASRGSAYAGGTLNVAMTAGDIPVTTGNPDQGFEGYRFVGYNLYDALLLWDLTKSDKPSEPKPGLATSYATACRSTRSCRGKTHCRCMVYRVCAPAGSRNTIIPAKRAADRHRSGQRIWMF